MLLFSFSIENENNSMKTKMQNISPKKSHIWDHRESRRVNEPSGFEPSKFYCIMNLLVISKKGSAFPVQ